MTGTRRVTLRSGALRAAFALAALAAPSLIGCTAANRQIQFSKPPPAVSKDGFICPLYGTVSSTFGPRVLRGKASTHKGIDVAGRLLVTPVFSAKEGVVTVATRSRTYGLWIEISHPEGWTTRYGHLSWMHAKKGQRVLRGDLIGRIGNSGRSYGAHLHFEVLHHGKAVDPLSVAPVPKPKPKPPPKAKPAAKPKALEKKAVPPKGKALEKPAPPPKGKAPAKPKTPAKPPQKEKAPAKGKPQGQFVPEGAPPACFLKCSTDARATSPIISSRAASTRSWGTRSSAATVSVATPSRKWRSAMATLRQSSITIRCNS